jgi:HEAT repeats
MIQENIDTKTRDLVGALSFDGSAAEDALREWFQMFPESLYRLAGTGLSHKAELFVHPLLAADRECGPRLCDPALMDGSAAVRLARSLLFLEPRLDRRLANAAIDYAATANQKPLRRCLEILEAMRPCPSIGDALARLLKCVDGASRSRVVDILVRSSPDEAGIRKWLRDPDPRVRANVLESLVAAGGGAAWVRELLLEHLHDPHWRVAANAAVGLQAVGMEEPALARLAAMASSKDANMRRSSAWAMGRVPQASILEILHRLRKDPDARVRWNALRSLSRLRRAGVKQAPEASPVESGQLPTEQPATAA